MIIAGVVIAILVVLAIVVIGLIMYFVGIYNSLVTLKNDIDRSFANIDVMLKQRHDELPKLVDTCKGYMQYEQKTLQAVTEARTAYMRATTPAEKTQADGMVSGRAQDPVCRGGEISRPEGQHELHATARPHHGTRREDRRAAQPLQ